MNLPKTSMKTKVQISVPCLCGLILFLLFDRTGLGGQMVLAALSHEIGHLLVMAFLGGYPQKIVFGGMGIRIEKRPDARLSYGREICIYAAGPAVNLLVAALFFPYPAIRRVHLLLGIFNLLPIGVLDGGQILRCFLQNKIEISRADRFQRLVSFFCAAGLVVLAAAVFWKSGYNASLLVTTGYLLWLLFVGNSEI